MPDEQRHATISGPAGLGNSTRRAGLLAMASVILRGGRRTSLAQPTGMPAEPPGPPPAYFNPLRLRDEQSSLFGEILDWMLAPLLLLWPMSVTITYLVAQSIANAPYDRALAENVDLLSDYVKEFRGQVSLQIPIPARDLLRRASGESANYMVLGLRGEFVAGERELPLPPEDEKPTPGLVKFRFDQMRGSEVRVAYSWVAFPRITGAQPALVQVAEPLDERSQLANDIIRGVIIPQFIVLPIAVALVWFALTRGLTPLNALQARIRARRPDDLSPIDPKAAPEELAPLVNSFNELLERLIRSMQTQKRFLADAAHQMKTPLAGLRTQAELALREADPQQLRSSLRQIAESSARATHLIDQLLALARTEHQATDLGAFEVVDVGLLARELVQEWVPQALARSIDLGFEGPEGTTPAARIIGVPVALREMLKNLVDNALRYTPSGGTVTVRVEALPTSVRIEVEDTGPGIPESERALIFERFYRVLGTNVDGSGLGLAIVREIVEQHDALLRVSSNPNCRTANAPGTRMSIEFTHIANAPPTVQLDR
jgi:two-component system, OmpR family, sensor histidine kinase TctE